MKLFALYNGCWWMVIDSLDSLMDNLSRINHLEKQREFFIEKVISGQVIFVNRNGGWHYGNIEDKTDYMPSKDFPTEKEAEEFLKLDAA